MAKVAQSDVILKKRLQRFFDQHNNSGRKQVKHIVNTLNQLGTVYLFGGAIRDIALQGIRNFYGDLDFVVDCNAQKLKNLMQDCAQNMPVHFNKFGGYRLHCQKWYLDIWPLEQTWAFQQNIIQYQGVNSLLQTTILNWDAIIYNTQTQQLIHSDDYFAAIKTGTLDLQLADNPNPLGAYVRILRCIVHKPVQHITSELYQYLQQQHLLFDQAQVIDYETAHYRQCYLTDIKPNIYHAFFAAPSAPQQAAPLLENSLQQSNLDLL